MTVITPDKTWKHPDPTTGLIRWSMLFTETDFNAAVLQVERTLFREFYETGPSYIDRISASWVSTTSGAGCRCGITAQMRSVTVKWVPIMTIDSTAAGVLSGYTFDGGVQECRVYIPNDNEIAGWPATYMIQVGFGGAANYTLDDFTMCVEGYTIPIGTNVPLYPTPTPVSLEAFKWPLTRRY